MSQNICIVGANGYIGRHLALHIKNSQVPRGGLLLCDLQEQSEDGHYEYRQLDILDREALAEAVVDTTHVYFLSGLTGTSAGFDNYAQFVSVNEIGLLNLLNACRGLHQCPKVIFPSTRLVYKGVSNTALAEDAEKELKTIYAINKYSCEQYLRVYAECFGVRYTVLRICVPYGSTLPASRSYGTLTHFVSQALEQKVVTIFGDGEQKRTLTHITDLCSTMIAAGLSPATDNDVFNIGGADVLSIQEIAQGVAHALGASVIYKSWPVLAQRIESGDTVFDSTKLDTRLGITYGHSYHEWLTRLPASVHAHL